MTDLTEAVEAGTRELHSLRCCDGAGPLACTPGEMTEDENNAINAIRAALPFIEKQIREQVADEIEAEYDRRRKILDHLSVGYHEGFLDALDAATIARTPKEKP